MLPLLLAALLETQSAVVIQQIRSVRTFTAPAETEAGRVAFAHDDQFEYLATPVGLMRSRRFADPAEPVEVIAFDGKRVNDVASNGRYLYVLLGNGIFSTAPEPTILRSGDQGRTFSPIDRNLAECLDSRCEYLVGHHIEIAGGRIVLEAGGNVLVTPDEGLHWYQLYGSSTKGVPDLQICPVVFTVGGSTLYLGGECPLDMAWLSAGLLTSDGLSWATPPGPVNPHLDFENRNVQFIRAGAELWAGLEGALIHGTGFALHYDGDDAKYPYIREFVASTKTSVWLAGGFDKAHDNGYLVLGSLFLLFKWQDVSYALPAGTTNVAMLAETADGTLLIAMQNGTRYTIGTIELGTPSYKRRAVVHR
jgi:hypothetical protein